MGAYRFIFSPLKTKGILDLVNKHANRRLEFLYGLSEEALYK